MAHHKQVRLVGPGIDFEVDEGIAPLIAALWQRGYKTTGSCEHQPGTDAAWISFESEEDAEAFGKFADGTVFQPNEQELARAHPGDPLTNAVAVLFPADSIAELVTELEES